MKLAGATAVITGGARRVGRHVARRLAERGANIVISYRTSAQQADEAVKQFRSLGVGALGVQADVATQAGVRRILDTALAEFGSVEVLVNNASVYAATPLDKLTEEELDRSIAVNLKGPFLACWLFGLHMREQGRGKIVNMADSVVDRPHLDHAPYFVAKGGVIALTKVMAKELAPQVQVNAVAPGAVLLPPDVTPETARAVEKATPLGRIGDPEDVAQTMLYLLEGTDFVTGAVIPVDGGRQVS